MIQSTAGMFGIFAGLGLGLTATKYVSEFRLQDPIRAGRILAFSACAAYVSASAMAALSFYLRLPLRSTFWQVRNWQRPLAIGSGLVFFGAVNGAQIGALAGFEAFKSIARVNIFSGLASFPLVALGVWRGGLEGAMWGSVARISHQLGTEPSRIGAGMREGQYFVPARELPSRARHPSSFYTSRFFGLRLGWAGDLDL